MLDLIDALGPETATVLVAVDDSDDTVIGCFPIAAVPNLMTGEPIAEELTWFVDPSHRGLRAGPKLLTAAIDWAMARGLKMLKMGAPAGSELGRFYEKHGFQAVETAYFKVL
jgi:GNAT superfamily N-acetyltransferase